MINPRTPVIVTAGQRSWRDGDTEPIAAMVETIRATLADGPALTLRDRIESVRVVGGIWPYGDPGRLVADGLGIDVRSTAMTQIGGNEVYDLVARTVADIQAGHLDVAVICAAETMRTRRRDKAAGRKTPYRPEPDGAAADVVHGSTRPLVDDVQIAAGIADPVAFYALAESALRHAHHETPDEHVGRIARLWADASTVATANPSAWIQDPVTAAEIATVTKGNRLVAHPYTKLMTANLDVDQSAAVIVTSLAAAARAGVQPGQMVFPIAATGAADHWHLNARLALHESPAMRIAGKRAIELAGWQPDEIDDVDLYSCFPAAVQVAQHELGLDPGRPFTITGGLTFAGGPFNSYCLHALARAVDRIQQGDSRTALLTGNGGYFTKHSVLALSTQPTRDGCQVDRPQDAVDAQPSRPQATSELTEGTIEAYTAIYDRDGSAHTAISSCLDGHGARHWVTTTEPHLIDDLVGADRVGATIHAGPGSAPGVAALLDIIRA